MNYKPHNQVMYQGKLASIARVYKDTADILMYISENESEYKDGVLLEDLQPIEISAKIVGQYKFANKIIQGRQFIFEHGKFRLDTYDNGAYAIYIDGKQITQGIVIYLHELQNIVGDFFNGYQIFI